jgi:hypothetical protein
LQSFPAQRPSATDFLGTVETHRDKLLFMMRTQVSLSGREYRAAKREARRLGISLDELVRRSLRAVLPPISAKPWMRFAGMIDTRRSEVCQNIDDFAYGRRE